MSFLFPKTTAVKVLLIRENLYLSQKATWGGSGLSQLTVATSSDEIYKSLRQFTNLTGTGINFLLSFIPGTKAYAARIELANSIKKMSTFLNKEIDKIQNHNSNGTLLIFHKLDYHAQLRGPLLEIITLGPVWRSMENRNLGRSIGINQQTSFKRLVYWLPIVSDIYFLDEYKDVHFQPSIAENLIHTLLNPVRIIRQMLFFTENALYGIMELGAKKHTPSSLFRIIPKFLVGFIFTPLHLALNTAVFITDQPYRFLKHVIYEPLSLLYFKVRSKVLTNTEQKQSKITVESTQSELVNHLSYTLMNTAMPQDERSKENHVMTYGEQPNAMQVKPNFKQEQEWSLEHRGQISSSFSKP